jgi:hypothetical protein
MRKVKEVLRLRLELGLGQRAMARSCGMGLSTVHDYLERAAQAGLSWPLAEGLGEAEGEGGKRCVERWIVTALRNRKFSSLPEACERESFPMTRPSALSYFLPLQQSADSCGFHRRKLFSGSDWPDNLALPDRGEARRWRDGCGV